jgi:pyruvate dehydrogenase E1 component
MYGGAQSILIGTPSGVTLAPEGGAHQSIITPSIGVEQPRCVAWEPAFGQDLEWTLLRAISMLGRADGSSSYFRLATRPIDQQLAAVPKDPEERERRRRLALAGGYPLRVSDAAPRLTLVGAGAIMPELLHAADDLAADDIPCDVVCLTSADLVFRAVQARQGLADGDYSILDALFPPDRAAPIVSVLDGHPHTLSFLSAIRRTPIASLGVDDFGQSGDVDDLYKAFGIDTDTIVGAAADLLD